MITNLMSMSCDTVQKLKTALLELDIADVVQLSEITTKVNALCEQAEKQSSMIIVLRLVANAATLASWPGQVSIQDVNRWERALRRLERIAAAIIAVVDAPTGGPAFDLLLISDYRIVSSDFRLQLPINEGQIWPSLALHRLVNQLNVARCRQLIMGEGDISAQHALNIGMIDEITDNTQRATRNAISRLGLRSNAEMAIRRQLLLEASSTPFEDATGSYLAACDRELRRLASHRDAKND